MSLFMPDKNHQLEDDSQQSVDDQAGNLSKQRKGQRLHLQFLVWQQEEYQKKMKKSMDMLKTLKHQNFQGQQQNYFHKKEYIFHHQKKQNEVNEKEEISKKKKGKKNKKPKMSNSICFYPEKNMTLKNSSEKRQICENKGDRRNAKAKEDKYQQKQLSRRQIQIKKANIKQFILNSRILPNSAFTTFFGKPAFENYGHGENSKQMTRHKSHSVMPHAGKNCPSHLQTHKNALRKAHMINVEAAIPKKSNMTHTPTQFQYLQKNYNVMIHKPDLMKEVKSKPTSPVNLYKKKSLNIMTGLLEEKKIEKKKKKNFIKEVYQKKKYDLKKNSIQNFSPIRLAQDFDETKPRWVNSKLIKSKSAEHAQQIFYS